jgi:aurora kinase
MMTAGVAKIGDFGCAVNGYCMRKSKIGSPAYLSPEQLNQNFYGKKIDIWSIGIITYEMLFGTTPFDK